MATIPKSEPDGFVYGIQCVANDKWYIGSTGNWLKRKAEHRDRLQSGQHENYWLQQDWNVFGVAKFRFVLMLTAAPGFSCVCIENAMILAFGTLDPELGYNQHYNGRASREARLRVQETKLVRSGKFVRLPGATKNDRLSPQYVARMSLWDDADVED